MKNVYAEGCPADTIRAYIEKLVSAQKECIEKDIPIPEEFQIPEDIVLSPQNIEYLLNSKYVDFYGSASSGHEIHFFWKTSKKAPALEIRVTQAVDGKCYLTYIKEDETETMESFVWDKNDDNGKRGFITVSKMEDVLEDIAENDYKRSA